MQHGIKRDADGNIIKARQQQEIGKHELIAAISRWTKGDYDKYVGSLRHSMDAMIPKYRKGKVVPMHGISDCFKIEPFKFVVSDNQE